MHTSQGSVKNPRAHTAQLLYQRDFITGNESDWTQRSAKAGRDTESPGDGSFMAGNHPPGWGNTAREGVPQSGDLPQAEER